MPHAPGIRPVRTRQTRAAVLTKIAETYPVSLDAKSVEQWRQQLKAQPLGRETPGGAGAAGAGKR